MGPFGCCAQADKTDADFIRDGFYFGEMDVYFVTGLVDRFQHATG